MFPILLSYISLLFPMYISLKLKFFDGFEMKRRPNFHKSEVLHTHGLTMLLDKMRYYAGSPNDPNLG
jgi:hypothetical protein